MSKGRLEAFSDGVIAVIITIMVLEMKTPHGTSLADLRPVLPTFLSYVLSFIYVAIYWNNHHHLFCAAQHVNGAVLWANLHLLFWLSLVPFATAWIGNNHFAPWPFAVYGIILLMAGVAYGILVRALICLHGRSSTLGTLIGSDWKGIISVVLYAIGIPLTFVQPWIGAAFYIAVAIIWLVPDRRIEGKLVEE